MGSRGVELDKRKVEEVDEAEREKKRMLSLFFKNRRRKVTTLSLPDLSDHSPAGPAPETTTAAAKKAASEAAAAGCCCLLLLMASLFEATIPCPSFCARFGTTAAADLDATAWRDTWSPLREEEETEKGIAGRVERKTEKGKEGEVGDRKKREGLVSPFFLS